MKLQVDKFGSPTHFCIPRITWTATCTSNTSCLRHRYHNAKMSSKIMYSESLVSNKNIDR